MLLLIALFALAKYISMYYIIIAAGLAAIVYFFGIKQFSVWKNRGVVQQNIWTIFMGNIKALLQTEVPVENIRKLYDSFDGQRCAGVYQFLTPILLLRDPDLIKQITVKDFDHFLDHNQFVSEEVEPLWGKNLFALKGDRWKDMRATLSPSFTSSKMRAMFGLMTECAQQFVRYFDKEGSKTVTIEFKDAFTRYTNDVIASTAFGITCDSLKERENEFYLMGKEATNFRGFWKNMSFFVMLFSPKLAKFFRIHLFSPKVSAFFRKLVKCNIESREKTGIVRPDMIHLLMEARKGKLKHEDNANGVADSGFAVIEESSIGKEEKRQKLQLSDDDVTAQALIFFFAGFDTVSQLMCFTIYELSINPDIQSKLRDEIDDTLRECGGNLTYEALLTMKYLDMVISESLRKWPGAVAVDRVCVKPYTIEPVKDSDKPIDLKKGDILWLPIYAIQRDPQFYPEPDRFDPERFSDENKSSVYPYTYIPFGSGPRSCIGNRFALLETKTVLFHLMAKFEFVVTEKSQVPLKLAKNNFNPTAENGFWFGLKPRRTVQ